MQKKKGISLIVLVITIIVMIILAAAVIISLNNSGIIDRASTAVKEHNLDEVNHIAQVAWSEAYLNGAKTQGEFEEAVTQALDNNNIDSTKYDITVTTSGVTVALKQSSGVQTVGWVQDSLTITKGDVTLEAGDLIQYNAGVQGYSGAWKVLGAEDGKLLIMSTADVSTLDLYGLEGYEGYVNHGLLNGKARLNELCEPYGNGSGAVGSRSIKVEDVEKLTGFDKTTFGANSLHQYGNEVTFSWNTSDNGRVDYTSTNNQSGTLAQIHSNGFSYVDFNTMQETTVEVNESGMPRLTSDYYNFSVFYTTLFTKSTKSKEMIFGEEVNPYYYWLASTACYINEQGVNYGLRIIYGGGVDMNNLFYSNGDGDYNEGGVRAVVELSPNIQIGTKDGTLGWSYTI